MYLYKEIKFKPNGFAMVNKRAAKALGKTYLYATIHPESLVQIQYNSTEMILIMPSSKIVLMLPLRRTKGTPEL